MSEPILLFGAITRPGLLSKGLETIVGGGNFKTGVLCIFGDDLKWGVSNWYELGISLMEPNVD